MPKGVNHTGIDVRLKRIEGQVRGVARMVQGKRYCIDILNQLTAVRRLSLRRWRRKLDAYQ